jgi:hypothetical protein
VVGIDFNDGSAHEDISKVFFFQFETRFVILTPLCQMIIFAAQNVLSRTISELGYLLLRCIRRYVDLDIYAALEVHTEDTIAAGRDALSQFSTLMDVGSMSFSVQYFDDDFDKPLAIYHEITS